MGRVKGSRNTRNGTWGNMGDERRRFVAVNTSDTTWGDSEPLNDDLLTGARSLLQQAFSRWTSVANITFVEAPPGAEANADIRIFFSTVTSSTNTQARGLYPLYNEPFTKELFDSNGFTHPSKAGDMINLLYLTRLGLHAGGL
jgi:hypothetical protein